MTDSLYWWGRDTIAAVKLSVITVGRVKRPYADDVAHYAALLGHYARLTLIEVRDDDQLTRRIPRERTFVSLLASEGESYDSVAFSEFIERRRQSGIDLCFVIGGAFGTSFAAADHRLSLGPMTLPHQLARVVLLEQLYRAHKILANEQYHY